MFVGLRRSTIRLYTYAKSQLCSPSKKYFCQFRYFDVRSSPLNQVEMAPFDISGYLDQTDISHYDINYDVYKFNHIAQGIIALSELGATQQQIDDYIALVSKELKQPDHSTSGPAYQNIPVSELLGKRKGYYIILSYYEELLKNEYNNDLEAFIRKEFSKLKTGFAGGAFHGIIQISYGYRARHPRIICEGFAYLHYTYRSLEAPLEEVGELNGDTDIAEVLRNVKADRELIQYRWEEPERGDWAKIYASKFDRALSPLLKNKGNDLLNYVKHIRIPDLAKGEDTKTQYLRLMNWILEQALAVYVSAERKNDFFLLHGVTSGWSLLNVLQLLEDETDIRLSILTFLCYLIGVYIVRGCPNLDFQNCYDNKAASQSWDDIKDDTLNNRTVEIETHVYKMVHICTCLSKSENFDSNKEILLKNAAMVAMHNAFPDLPDRAGLL